MTGPIQRTPARQVVTTQLCGDFVDGWLQKTPASRWPRRDHSGGRRVDREPEQLHEFMPLGLADVGLDDVTIRKAQIVTTAGGCATAFVIPFATEPSEMRRSSADEAFPSLKGVPPLRRAPT
jgi:hypothetical protein